MPQDKPLDERRIDVIRRDIERMEDELERRHANYPSELEEARRRHVEDKYGIDLPDESDEDDPEDS
jgi:hypothetical protein